MGFFASSGILNRRGFFGGATAAPAFLPSDLPNLIMWLDANDTATLFDATSGGSTVTTNDTAIARWEDKSTSAKHFKQSTSNNRPKLFTSSQNSKNIIRFDGSNDRMNMDSEFSGYTEVCYFIALKRVLDPPTTASRTGHPIFFFSGASSNSHYPWTDGSIYDYTLTNSRKTAGNPTPSLANFHLYNVEAKSALWTARVNKAQLFTTTTNTIERGGTAIGGDLVDVYSFDGDIGELIAYSSILSSTDRGKVEDYLYSKWGI
jgi:hypothetical protein